MNRKNVAAAVLLAMSLSSCATELHVQSVDPMAKAPEKDKIVDGIPFRILKRYKVEVYQKVGEKYELVYSEPQTLADQEHLFVLDFDSALFSKGSVDVSFNNDNTLQKLEVKDSSQLSKAITEIGAQTTAVTTAINTAETAAQASDQAKETAKASAITAVKTNEIEAERARALALDAEALRARLDGDTTATAEQRRKAASDERIAKLVANEKARIAGMAPFFPDIVPGVY